MHAKVDDTHITLITRATPAVMAMIKGIEGRRSWINGGGLRMENTAHNLRHIQDYLPGLTINNKMSELKYEAKTPLRFLREPSDHQRTALEKSQGQKFFGLFMEQGTGKTKVAIDHARRLFVDDQITGMLVVTRKGVHRQWIESEFPKDYDGPFTGCVWNKKPLPEEVKAKDGTLKVFSINYDALRTDKGFLAANSFCYAHKDKLFIVADESQDIKNHRSIRHKRMMLLKPLASHRFVMTGTPIAKDLTDEWAQLRWLDERIIGCKYITTFRAQYCLMGGFEDRSVIGHKNIDKFQQLTKAQTFRVTKEQIGILPKRYDEWCFDLTLKQKAMIKEVKQSLTAELESGKIISVANAAAAFTKIQQISNGFIIDEEGSPVRIMKPDSNPRAVAAMEWVKGNDSKAIIWARFREDMRILSELLTSSKVSFVQYHGGTNDSDRKKAVDSFLSEDGAQVLLANAQSAGTGLNLQGLCNRAIYYSNSFAAIDRWQSEDRIHRIGTKGAVTYTDLIGRSTIDRYILRNLKAKKGLSQLTLGDLENAFI